MTIQPHRFVRIRYDKETLQSWRPGLNPTAKVALLCYLGQLQVSDPVSYLERGKNSTQLSL